MITLFWISVAGILLVYAGYPVILWIAVRLRGQAVQKSDIAPKVSILISAYNEESCIGQTVQNKLALDYPAGQLEVIVISDGSIDRTEEIVRSIRDPRLKLLVQEQRQGKTAALNRAVLEATGEIVVFSDANSIYQSDALKKIVSNFSDPRVGYVTGKMVYVDEQGSLVGGGCSAYMRYENMLRALESRFGSVIGVDGGIDAVRRSLYEPMRSDLLPDFVLPLRVVAKGFRVVYEDAALLMEHTLTEVEDELRMRVRVILRAFHALWFMRGLFNPLKSGFFSVQLFVHKFLRYMAGFLQVTALISNYLIVSEGRFYMACYAFQLIFYLCAFGGFMFKDRKNVGGLFKYAYYFCLLNYASSYAFVKFLRGERQVIWQPRKGN